MERVDSDKFPRIVREESHGLRNPRFFPGEQSRISQPVDFSREKADGMAISARILISAQAGGSLLALATPLRSVNTADAALRIGTISQAHAIPCWACIYLMVRFAPFFLFRPSIQSALSGATKQPTGPYCLRAGLASFLWCASRRFFCFGPRCNRPSAALQNSPQGCFVHAPPLNLSWRQAS